MKNSYLKNTQQGMTLIEILVAMTLGTFLMAGVMQIFLSSKKSYHMQDNISRLQENGRFAMEFISRDIRMADYWGCLGGVSDIGSNLNPGSTYDDFAKGVAGTNDDNDSNDGDANNDENANNIWDGTDSITLRGAFGADIFVTDIPANTSANLKVTNESGLVENNIVIVSDCSAGDIFQITNDPSTGAAGHDVVVHNTGSVETGPGNVRKEFSKLYGTDAQIYKMSFVEYKIDESAGVPALFRSINGATSEALIEGIENMQILYGEDTDADGTPNYFVDADTVVDMGKVLSVRITLTVRTIDNNLSSTGDGRIRRTFSSTLVLRNRL